MKNRKLIFNVFAVLFGVSLIVLTTSWNDIDPICFSGKYDSDNGTEVKMAQQYFSMLRRNQVTEQIDPEDVLRAREQALYHANTSSGRAIGLNWEELGSDNFGSRTRSLLIDNRDASHSTLYAGSVNGGIWKSTNKGLTWHETNTSQFVLNVSCMAQATNGTIYVGTGESFIAGAGDGLSLYEGLIGRGMFKSTDGETFALISSTLPVISGGSSSDWAYINKITVDPSNDWIYAATNGGLKYSDDGGVNWKIAETTEGDTLYMPSTDVSITDGMIVAAVNDWFYITTNGNPTNFVNQSTKEIITSDSTINPEKLPKNNILRLVMSIAPSDPNIVYALTVKDDALKDNRAAEFGQLEGIYLSEDKGNSWTLIGPGGSEVFDVLGTEGKYSSSLIVSPDNPYHVFAGGLDLWEGTKVADSGYYNWGQKSTSFSLSPLYVHSYHHIYVFDPSDPNILYIGTDGGIFVTDDGFNSFKSINKQYDVDMFYSVAYTNDGRIMGGTHGNGVLYIDKQGNTTMTASQLGEFFVGDIGGYSEISMIFPECFILSGTQSNLLRSNNEGVDYSPVFLPTLPNTNTLVFSNPNGFITPFALWESFDNPNSRDSVLFVPEIDYAVNDTIMVESFNNNYPFNYITPEPVNAGDSLMINDPVSTRFFVAVENEVWMTKEVLNFNMQPNESKARWFQIAEITGMPLCLAFTSDANYLYVGTSEGNLYRIANLALAYDYDRADINSASCVVSTTLIGGETGDVFNGRAITSLAVDPNNDNNLIITLGNYGNTDYVYRSTNVNDFMPSFVSIQGNLPKMPVYSSLIEMNMGERVILGTELGVFSTENLDGNVEWSWDGDGIGAVPVFSLRQQKISQWPIQNYGEIYAASFGRGLFKSNSFVGINEWPESSTIARTEISVYPNPASTSITISYELENNKTGTIAIYDLNSRLFKTIELQNKISGMQEITIDCMNFKQGTYFLNFVSGDKSAFAKFIVLK